MGFSGRLRNFYYKMHKNYVLGRVAIQNLCLGSGEEFKSVDELEQKVKEYIHYYNHERIKVKLKGLTPVEYRNQSLKTA